MADNSKIEWCDATWNPVTGCAVVSPGCTNCYAMRLAGTRLRHHPSRKGLTRDTKAGPVWTGEVRLNPEWLDQPRRWRRPRRIFVCAHGDLFAEAVPDDWIDRVFAQMALCPQHVFIVLTKRAQRMRDYLDGREAPRRQVAFLQVVKSAGSAKPVAARSPMEFLVCAYGWPIYGEAGDWPLPNVWLGVSVEDQARADERIPLLLDTPAAKRFVSAEPLLGPVDLSPWLAVEQIPLSGGPHWTEITGEVPQLDWVIAGGESGPGARPMHPGWARALRDQCRAAGVPFFFKQWGEWLAGENLGPDKNPDWPLAQWQDGNLGRHPSPDHIEWRHFTTPGELGAFTIRVGKKAAGRLLDGREWSEFPV